MFSIFISNLGLELNSSGLGIPLSSLNISSIFFADDLVLLGSSRNSLDQLLDITRKFFKNHHLTLSESKSKLLSHNATTGKTEFHSNMQLPPISLEEVLSFKYLGIPLSSSPYMLFKYFNDQVKLKANNYLHSVLSLVKTGPDRADLAYTLWTRCALPSILYGSEIIPLDQRTINEIVRCQSLVGKFILQIPRNSTNVCASLDAGLKPVWAVIAEKVLVYANNTMKKPLSYWPKLAMNENVNLGTC